MRPIEKALQQLKETPEEKICEIFAAEAISPPAVSHERKPIDNSPSFIYEGKVTILDHSFPDCRSIVLDETGSDSDDALTLEDILPHVVFLSEPTEEERNNLRLRIVIEKIDAE